MAGGGGCNILMGGAGLWLRRRDKTFVYRDRVLTFRSPLIVDRTLRVESTTKIRWKPFRRPSTIIRRVRIIFVFAQQQPFV